MYTTDAETLDDFTKLLEQHEFVKSVFDVREWIKTSIPKYISGTTEPLHFKFELIMDKVQTFYKGEHDHDWISESTGFLLEIPKGEPNHVCPNFEDFQEDKFFKLIEHNKALFKKQNIMDLWKKSLKEIKRKKKEKWMLSELPKQPQQLHVNNVRLANEVENILDKENRNPQVIFISKYVSYIFFEEVRGHVK